MIRRIVELFLSNYIFKKTPLYGDREIEWAWVAANLNIDQGMKIVDFGPATSNTPLMSAFYEDVQVLAIDQLDIEVPYYKENITYSKQDLLQAKQQSNFTKNSIDLIINCSTIEHVGLAGRYESSEDPDGDLKVMNFFYSILKNNGRMILTIPIGVDTVCSPYHRIYGKQRLPNLLNKFHIERELYFGKSRNLISNWKEIDKQDALHTHGGPDYYALGLYVLRKF